MSYVNNLRMFIRVCDLGSMSAAARDQRTSPAVASARIADLEKHLGVRLFNRTTRSLQPTEQGRLFYEGACTILESIAEAEGKLGDGQQNPRGKITLAAPLGLGRRLIAPLVPKFRDLYPAVEFRMRLSDRPVDLVTEGIDIAFHLGELEDSTQKMRQIAECPRLLCAAPAYIARRGMAEDGAALLRDGHDCLNLRFPGAREFRWTLQGPDGPEPYAVSGPLESDDGDVLTAWALEGRGIVLKPVFEVARELAQGLLVPVATASPPLPVPLTALSQHRRLKDPKLALFSDFTIAALREEIRRANESLPG